MSPGSGIKSGLLANSGTGQNIASTGANNAQGLYGTLSPALTQEATNPQGINPADLAKMNTAAQQSAGGSNAGAVGQGSLLSARTRNAGSGAAAIAKSAEGAQQQLGNEAVGIQNENTQTKLKQQQQGLSGLQNLYGTNEGEALGGLGASSSALKDAASVPNFWQQLALQGVQSAGNALKIRAGG
jgi:hypothetical protein